MPQVSTSKAGKKPTARSRVTNGSKLHAGVDGRSTWARRMRDIIASLSGDLGGEERLSEAQRSVVRRCATLMVELEGLEGSFASAGSAQASDLALYNTVAGNLRRMLETVGLDGRASRVHEIRPGDPVPVGVGVHVYPPNYAHPEDPTQPSDRHLARVLAFKIHTASQSGDPIPEALTEIAVMLGYSTTPPVAPADAHDPANENHATGDPTSGD